MAELLQCSVCLDNETDAPHKIFASPCEDEHRAQGCGHFCCTGCWKDLLSENPRCVKCPVCRRDVTSWAVTHDFEADRLVSLQRLQRQGNGSQEQALGPAQPVWLVAAQTCLAVVEWSAVAYILPIWSLGWALYRLSGLLERAPYSESPRVPFIFSDKAMKIAACVLGILGCLPWGLEPVLWALKFLYRHMLAMLKLWIGSALSCCLLRLTGNATPLLDKGPLMRLWHL